jgi:glutathione S-transferase
VDDISGASLWPKDSKQRALVEQWISVEQSHHNAADKLVYELYFKKMRGAEADKTVVEEETKRLHSCYKIMNEHLHGKTFLVGDSFSLADIVFMPYLNYLQACEGFKEILSAHPNVAAWWKAITSRPSWQKTLSLLNHK